MARSIVPTDFFSEMFFGAQTLPLKGFAFAAGLGLIDAALDLLFRHLDTRHSALGYGLGGALIIATIVTVYGISMMIADAKASWLGGLRFLLTTILVIGLPLGMIFAGLWVLRSSGVGAISIFSAVVLAVVFIAIPLLSGWPPAQAISGRFVSPLRILKATKGYRWGLITACFASTALNKVVPATNTAKSGGQAMLLAIGNGAAGCASLILLASIAATAWKFAVRQDSGLAPSVYRFED